jgi:ABC-type amino acid transport system permease subunit
VLRRADPGATDWALLFGALVTLKITLLAFFCATVLGVLIAFLFVQSRDRDRAVSLRGAAAGDAHRGHRAADHHLGQGPDLSW